MFNFAQYLTNNGIPEETFYLLLVLPFVVLIITFFRYVIGLKSFSIYEPLIIAYALYFISNDFWIGLKFGVPFIFSIWLVGEILGRIFKNAKVHHYSIIAIKLSVASLLVIGVLTAAVLWGRTGFFTINALPLLIMVTMIEAVSVFQVKKGNFQANLLTLETLIISFISYAVISAHWFVNILVNNYYIVLIPVLLNYLIGRYSGLKLSEIIRFRNVLKND